MKRRDGWKEFWLFAIRATVVSIIAGSFAYFLIRYGEIAQALTPWATLLLALAAFWAIWQNYSLHKRERKERLLNEIIEWAIEVARCARGKEILPILYKAIVAQQDVSLNIDDLETGFELIKGRTVYINKVSLAFGKDLQKAVYDLRHNYESQIHDLDRLKRDKSDEKLKRVILTSLNDKILDLDKLSDKVIEEASKIKTKDTG